MWRVQAHTRLVRTHEAPLDSQRIATSDNTAAAAGGSSAPQHSCYVASGVRMAARNDVRDSSRARRTSIATVGAARCARGRAVAGAPVVRTVPTTTGERAATSSASSRRALFFYYFSFDAYTLARNTARSKKGIAGITQNPCALTLQKHAMPGSARTHAMVLYCTPTFDAIWWYESMLLNTVQVLGCSLESIPGSNRQMCATLQNDKDARLTNCSVQVLPFRDLVEVAPGVPRSAGAVQRALQGLLRARVERHEASGGRRDEHVARALRRGSALQVPPNLEMT